MMPSWVLVLAELQCLSRSCVSPTTDPVSEQIRAEKNNDLNHPFYHTEKGLSRQLIFTQY